ncbi:hypothetical protein GGR53DRAFT_184495 [Hypoxylon sp. FL1150]|nr:hypothetical protein GGR53DRAFT_184495 [Hypoxylon sp. FL1150]
MRVLKTSGRFARSLTSASVSCSPTGRGSRPHIDDDREVLNLEALRIAEEESAGWPVWLYGNWWAAGASET